MALKQHGDSRLQLAAFPLNEGLHRSSENSYLDDYIASLYPRFLSTASAEEQVLQPRSKRSYTDFFGREFEFDPLTRSYAQVPVNTNPIESRFMGLDNYFATGLVPQPPLYAPSSPTSSSSAPSFGSFSTKAEDRDLFRERSYPERLSSDALVSVSDFGNDWDQSHFEYSRERVHETIGGLPFASSRPSIGVAPQPCAPVPDLLAANVPPPSSYPSNSFVHPSASSMVFNYPPMFIDPSTIHNSTSRSTESSALDPTHLDLDSLNDPDAKDEDKDVQQVEVQRATKTGRARSGSAHTVSSFSSGENRLTEGDDTYVYDGGDSDDGEEYQPSPPKRRRTVASTVPSASRAVGATRPTKSSSASKSSLRKPQPPSQRKSRTTRVAASHPSGYHLDGTGCSNIHEWLGVFFDISKAKEPLTHCAFCGVLDGGLPRHVRSNVNHGIDWMLGILVGTLCGSLLLDALNYTVIWAEMNKGPLSKDEAAERDLLLHEYSDRSSHIVQALRFGDKPFDKLYRIAKDWAQETDATAFKCGCGMKATLRHDVLIRHLRKSPKCRALPRPH